MMGRSIGGHDDEDVDPNAPTRRIYGKSDRSDREDDGNRPTIGTRQGGDAEGDEDRTRRFAGKRSADTDTNAAAAERLPVGWLVVVKGPGIGHVLTIQTGMNILGRGKESQIVLDFGDRTIAREDHVRFVYNRLARRFHVAPGRGPETWLKGELVMQPEPIVRGDLVTVGETVLRFIPFCDEAFDWSAPEAE